MHIGWSRIWKVLLGCACAVGSIVLLACGLVGWGIAALEAAALLLALQYAPRAARLWKTWWFVELVLVLAPPWGTPALPPCARRRRRHPPSSSRRSATRLSHRADRNTRAAAPEPTSHRHGGSNLCRQRKAKIPPAVVPVRRQIRTRTS
ncbi:MAG: hypothetical protein ACLTG4_08010 [Oscillospiraceae bacterium]